MLQQIAGIWWALPITGLAFLPIYFLMHPDKVVKWSGILAKCVSAISMRAERRTIDSDIHTRVTDFILDNNMKEIVKYGLKIKWVTTKENSSFIDKNDVIVVMNHHSNSAINFLNAILQYTELALLPDVRADVPTKTMSAIELLVQEKMIREQRPDALPRFRKEVVQKKLSDEPIVETLVEKLRRLDSSGWFHLIYLTEIQYVGSKLYGLPEDEKNTALNNFLKFLLTIVERVPGTNVELRHTSPVFKLHILLVARSENLLSSNTGVYVDYAKDAALVGLDSLYVAGMGLKQQFTEKVIDEINRQNIGSLLWVKKHQRKDIDRPAVIGLFRGLSPHKKDQ